MFDFVGNARLIRKDLQPSRPIFLVAEVFLASMLVAFWLGWSNLLLFRSKQNIVEVGLNDIALIGFIGFYGVRISMFIAIARGLRMPQQVEWLVAILPASIALICLVLSGPIERAYIAANGYHYCGSRTDPGTRSSLYTFAAESVRCPDRRKVD